MWIRGGGRIPKADEADTIRASIYYLVALNADLHTLRNGTTMVMDTAAVKPEGPKVGNERKMQKTWQRLPSRPQAIHILGAGAFKRVFLTAAIKFASLFTKQKVLDRIKFSTCIPSAPPTPVAALTAARRLPDVEADVPEPSQPGGADANAQAAAAGAGDAAPPGERTRKWVLSRIANFPELPDQVEAVAAAVGSIACIRMQLAIFCIVLWNAGPGRALGALGAVPKQAKKQ